MDAADHFTALAVCGCGHDGRLGLGTSEVNVGSPTLLPFGLPASPNPASPPAVRVLAVACGGYHTLVHASDGLYGWGLNDCGQLGIGKHPPQVTSPMRVPFFDRMAAASPETEHIVRVSCGNRHSFVLTTEALYCCGANDEGQLGIGAPQQPQHEQDACVYEWLVVCIFGDRRHEAAPKEGSPAHSMLPSPPVLMLSPVFEISACTIVDVSCGTNHTLLSLENTLTRRRVDPAASEKTNENVDGTQFWPSMVLASGQGDYGELGYDGTAEEVERSRHHTQQEALLRAALSRDAQKDAGGHGSSDAALSTETAGDPLFKFKKKHAKVQRRPPFSSSSFRLVHFPTDVVGCEVFTPIPLPDGEAQDGDALRVAMDSQRNKWASGCTRIRFLDASHLHSAISLCPSEQSVLHWGCYYCNKVETLASSVPRSIEACEQASNDAVVHRVHGGSEILFHYTATGSFSKREGTGSAAAQCVRVMGMGNLGLGDEDDFSDMWRELPGTEGVVKVTGRNHFLMLRQGAPEDGGTTAVLGFGENLHGQLGAVGSGSSGGDEADSVVAPRVLLKRGDRLGDHWVVERVRDVAAGARHSVFLLDVKYDFP